MLFVGPSETSLLPRERFVSAQLPMAFAFRLAPEGTAHVPPARKRVAHPPVVHGRARRAAAARARPATPPAPGKGNPEVADPVNSLPTLAQVRTLADQGRLAEARAAGERLLREQGPGADVFCLLGTIRGANGDSSAADALYRKALYLEPAHPEALAHLALLLEARGRGDQARVLRARLRRAGGEGGGA